MTWRIWQIYSLNFTGTLLLHNTSRTCYYFELNYRYVPTVTKEEKVDIDGADEPLSVPVHCFILSCLVETS